MSETKYDCTSCTANGFYFVAVNQRVCAGCIRHFWLKYTFLFPPGDFSLVDFCVILNSFFLLVVLLIVKYVKKIYRCDCFLDISCSDDDFVDFQSKCLKERKFKDIFVIRSLTEGRYSQFYPTKFVVCCKAFVDFQIDLFVTKKHFLRKKFPAITNC